jgi:hypothetical protein
MTTENKISKETVKTVFDAAFKKKMTGMSVVADEVEKALRNDADESMKGLEIELHVRPMGLEDMQFASYIWSPDNDLAVELKLPSQKVAEHMFVDLAEAISPDQIIDIFQGFFHDPMDPEEVEDSEMVYLAYLDSTTSKLHFFMNEQEKNEDFAVAISRAKFPIAFDIKRGFAVVDERDFGYHVAADVKGVFL